jgi:hypothetical protein
MSVLTTNIFDLFDGVHHLKTKNDLYLNKLTQYISSEMPGDMTLKIVSPSPLELNLGDSIGHKQDSIKKFCQVLKSRKINLVYEINFSQNKIRQTILRAIELMELGSLDYSNKVLINLDNPENQEESFLHLYKTMISYQRLRLAIKSKDKNVESSISRKLQIPVCRGRKNLRFEINDPS